ncbi:hypothetical protein JVX90_04255 [Gordonia sp. PDNC005]|uniref:hypothetical protein n=1 Tax=Gordonia sp. PDNC005 TaxID=2811424 RepID=UPI0019641B21|nr:hypothetical protein [Gordonia sp. PDNC005]QRY63452.1 hypothetical protein JVX90_04255 [Gordonia sp. PDNC005]
MKSTAFAPLLVAVALLVGCSSGDESGTPPQAFFQPTRDQATLASVVAAVQGAVPQATKTIGITEDNDPNKLIGRPNGYVGATVIEDSRIKCSEGRKIGVSCGAMVEEWPDNDSAQRRSAYIRRAREGMPILGQEYDYVRGPFLLRVSGDLKPSQAKKYEQAFTD